MKAMSIIIAACLFAVSGVQAQTQLQDQEQCKSNVKTFLNSIDAVKEWVGVEKKPFGLTAQEVKRIQSERGDCEAATIIRKRMWETPK